MSIEVTDADVEAVEAIIGRDSVSWDYVSPKEIIAAAWEVMSQKHGLEAAIEEACRDLPEDYEIQIWVERGAAGVECLNPDGDRLHGCFESGIVEQFREKLQCAIVDSRK